MRSVRKLAENPSAPLQVSPHLIVIPDHVEVQRGRLCARILYEHEPQIQATAAFIDPASKITDSQADMAVGLAELLSDLLDSLFQLLLFLITKAQFTDRPAESGGGLNLTKAWSRSPFFLRLVLSGPA
jgi:hypothetical protein